MKFTDYLAIYAAILSTLVFGWNVYWSRPRFALELLGGIASVGDAHVPGFYIAIKNPSSQVVHIQSASIVYQALRVSLLERVLSVFRYRRIDRFEGWVHCFLDQREIKTGLPISIEPGKAHDIFIPHNSLLDLLGGQTKFAAEVHDALWRRKYSKVFDLRRD